MSTWTQRKPFTTCYRVECDMNCPAIGQRTSCCYLQAAYAAITETSNQAAHTLEAQYTQRKLQPVVEVLDKEQAEYILVFGNALHRRKSAVNQRV